MPALDIATRYQEVGEALLPLINPRSIAKYGIEMPSFILENCSVPPEVEAAIDKRSSMSAIGNLNDYVKYQMAQGMAQPGGGGGVAGSAAEVAMGFAMAQQMANQPGGILGGGGQPAAAAGAAAPPRRLPERAHAGRRRQGRSASPKPTCSPRSRRATSRAEDRLGLARHQGARSTTS